MTAGSADPPSRPDASSPPQHKPDYFGGDSFGMAPPQGIRGKLVVRDFAWGPVLRDLSRHYARGFWRVPVLRERGADPFHVLVSTVLSQRSRDEATLDAFHELSKVYPDARTLADAEPERVRALIRQVGLSKSKADGLILLANVLVLRFGGLVPRKYADLLTLPMVGPKTASAVIVFGFKDAAIPVDTHIHRVVNRLGVVHTSTPEETKDRLETLVPRRYWSLLNPVLVQHGQNICRARAPKCQECPVSTRCHWWSSGGGRISMGKAA